uniref:Putative uncharacterized protein YLL020C n=1 Tax=Saccharomyces cerevisiae (strain ATCC 204508 / S288c) TaxID=559292 RepID=YL020_YEAST|nr:RecName: Full=Putative uncharacterized protein YLL020C [Saccharomyces cerevisiae S288C]CAA97467.1 unnamed protein product [Saccharomyces cerevisiae]
MNSIRKLSCFGTGSSIYSGKCLSSTQQKGLPQRTLWTMNGLIWAYWMMVLQLIIIPKDSGCSRSTFLFFFSHLLLVPFFFFLTLLFHFPVFNNISLNFYIQ